MIVKQVNEIVVFCCFIIDLKNYITFLNSMLLGRAAFEYIKHNDTAPFIVIFGGVIIELGDFHADTAGFFNSHYIISGEAH